MWTSSLLTTIFLLASNAVATPLKPNDCFDPEPDRRICYGTAKDGGEAQLLNIKELQSAALYFRGYSDDLTKKGQAPLYQMKLPDADNCAEWKMLERGNLWVMAKLVGDKSAAVSFRDVANTIVGPLNVTDPLTSDALAGCGNSTVGSKQYLNGGQMGVVINATDEAYAHKNFTAGGYTNKGIVIKLVRNPNSQRPTS